MIDLNGQTRKQNAIVELIDKALIAKNGKAAPRNYLGASLLGEECLRKLQFHFFHVPYDEGKGPDGRILRIFERGNDSEKRMISHLRLAGFDLRTTGKNGRQFEFSLLDGLIKGHCDGVIVAGPQVIQYPALWENKCLGAKYWKQLEKERLKKFSPVYYGQVQIYMAYFELTDNPALFTAVNADTEEAYVELVPFDAETAQKVSDAAVTVIKACQAGELLPRLSDDPSFFKCRWCDWHDRCFAL
jgi:hypothetical protein